MPGPRTVITNGHVLSMDPEIGELADGAGLIEDGRIVAVARGLAEVDAEVIDADGGVIMPGFVDTHRHTWQTSLRAICADWTLFDYTIGMRMTLSPRCTWRTWSPPVRRSRSAASSSPATPSTRASATWRSSRTPTGTR